MSCPNLLFTHGLNFTRTACSAWYRSREGGKPLSMKKYEQEFIDTARKKVPLLSIYMSKITSLMYFQNHGFYFVTVLDGDHKNCKVSCSSREWAIFSSYQQRDDGWVTTGIFKDRILLVLQICPWTLTLFSWGRINIFRDLCKESRECADSSDACCISLCFRSLSSQFSEYKCDPGHSKGKLDSILTTSCPSLFHSPSFTVLT